MRVATIVPTKYLYLTERDNYYMALAHLVGEDREYTRFFRSRKFRSSSTSPFVILDNGVIEGDQQSIDKLLLKAYQIFADEVVLPDVFMDKEKTLIASYEALDFCYKYDVPFRVMVVPQGKTLDEWIQCAKEMIAWPVHTIGVPKVLDKITPGGRYKALIYVYRDIIDRDKEIHLLGCNDFSEMFRIKRDFRQIRGIDSAIAYVYTKAGLILDKDKDRPDVPVDLSDEKVDEELLRENIEIWRESCR